MTARRALHVLIALSLWHAPIPWIHVHEFEGGQVDRLATLARHIASFHAGDVSWGITSADWHSHLVLPWCLSHRHNCPAEDQDDHGPDDIVSSGQLTVAGVTPGHSLGQPATRAFLASGILCDRAPVAQLGTGSNGSRACGPSPFRHFFGTYGNSVALCDLTRVRLC